MTDTKQEIITIVIKLIEQVGVQSLTSRFIAKEAGINVASINYHFGSKDELVRLSLEQAIENGLEDIRAFANQSEMSLHEKLFTIAIYLSEGMSLYPNLTKSNLYNVIMKSDYSGPFITSFNSLIGDLLSSHAEAESDEFKDSVSQLFNVIFMTGIAPKLFADISSKDLTDQTDRRAYIASLFKSLFTQFEGK